MSNARKQVMDMIGKRVKKTQANKTRAAQRMGVSGIVLQFVENVEKVSAEAKGPLDFDTGLEREARLMHDRLRAIDPGVNVEIVWNNESNTENWKDLQVEGIKIAWSSFYLGKHPFSDPEKYVDVASLLLVEGMSEE